MQPNRGTPDDDAPLISLASLKKLAEARRKEDEETLLAKQAKKRETEAAPPLPAFISLSAALRLSDQGGPWGLGAAG